MARSDAARIGGARLGPALASLALDRARAGETLAAVAFLHALGASGDTASWEVPAILLAHDDRVVRGTAAKVLGEIGETAWEETAGSVLIRALADPETFVRRLAADAFTRRPSPDAALRPLAGALEDPDAWVAIAAPRPSRVRAAEKGF